jgi:hypothetical protein
MIKKFLLIVLLVPGLTFAQSRKQRKAQEKADKITLANLKANIQFLAADKLEGRRAGSAGETLAMDYIAQQFQKAGLLPKGTNGFIQEFEINEGKAYDSSTTMIVNDTSLTLTKDFFPLAFSANKSAEGMGSLSLREKGDPWFYDVKDVLDENKNNPHFNINNAIYNEANNVAKRGGTALIVFNSSASVDNVLFNRFDSSKTVSIPVVYITPDALKKYFKDVTDIYNISLHVQLKNKKRTAHNVVGYIDNNAATSVIIGAHYDHLGYGEDGNALDGKGQIHNGADDNASGTAALIELARMLKSSDAKNNNYVFVAFSGEELGLYGSKYWLQNMPANINPNYMINLDMIGRYDPVKKLTIGGYGTSPVWGQVFSTTTDKNIVVHFDSSGLGPSDHATFYTNNIPVLFFFTNVHSDYHKATDDADKINYTGELEIVKYIDKIIEASDSRGKLAFTKTHDAEIEPVALPVTLGVMPDYAYSGSGLRIDGVTQGKTAEAIGLKAGDILLQLGDFKFNDIQTYMKALQHFKKGDTTKLYVKRDDEMKVYDITF